MWQLSLLVLLGKGKGSIQEESRGGGRPGDLTRRAQEDNTELMESCNSNRHGL